MDVMKFFLYCFKNSDVLDTRLW